MEKLEEMYQGIQPPEVNDKVKGQVSSLAVSLYRTLYEAHAKTNLLNKAFLDASMADPDTNPASASSKFGESYNI